ncbi:hypothetical protein KC571_01210 [candidate division WWE3 bacterium]|uniref:Uncharacterized protein n=1 Tax=candidate division WWE3 bacterium TaxID=2053526 RepID=A0A955RP94_UNCKA|nr:hypothetical protein [candidate division WWE3 bacterium]
MSQAHAFKIDFDDLEALLGGEDGFDLNRLRAMMGQRGSFRDQLMEPPMPIYELEPRELNLALGGRLNGPFMITIILGLQAMGSKPELSIQFKVAVPATDGDSDGETKDAGALMNLTHQNVFLAWRLIQLLLHADEISTNTVTHAHILADREMVAQLDEWDTHSQAIIEFGGQANIDAVMTATVPEALLTEVLLLIDDEGEGIHPSVVTAEIAAGTILWDDDFVFYGILTPDEAAEIAAAREALLDTFRPMIQSYVTMFGHQPSIEKTMGEAGGQMVRDVAGHSLEHYIVTIAERMPELTTAQTMALAVSFGKLMLYHNSKLPGAWALDTAAIASASWTSAHFDEHYQGWGDDERGLRNFLMANGTVNITSLEKVRQLQYGNW